MWKIALRNCSSVVATFRLICIPSRTLLRSILKERVQIESITDRTKRNEVHAGEVLHADDAKRNNRAMS
jgi:hypothetical protein